MMEVMNGHDVSPSMSLPKSTSIFHRTLTSEPHHVTHAKGSYLYLDNGKRVLDACGGAAVVSIGHAREEVARAIADQASKISYAHSLAYTHGPAEELADKLCQMSGMERALFYSGGTEAIDCSLKLVRQYWLERKQPSKAQFIARQRSYHGNSLSTLALSHHLSRRAPFEPLFASVFQHVLPAYAYRYQRPEESTADFVKRLADDLEAKILALGPENVAAFYAETIVGATTGCVPAPEGYFKAMRAVCDKYDVLLVLDEIMSGMGRSGKMFAYEWEGMRPDIVVCGKGAAGGYVPLSVILSSQKVVKAFREGSGAFNNGHTFQSHVLGCRAGLAVLDIMEKEQLVENCNAQGIQLEQSLKAKLGEHEHVGDIRGRGLFWGIEFVRDKDTKSCYPVKLPLANLIVEACMLRGVAVYPGVKGTFDGVQGDHVLVAPPYNITTEELDTIVDTLAEAINAVFSTIDNA